jgi:uncharacterized protein YajQ (UPF0234 family)|tara:strand:- start:18798 stop:19283 length:486 start_codon:yes stop_codon:yes gene_type:complete
MPSFDIISEVEESEIRNAAENTQREIPTRYDFRGVDASVSCADSAITLKAEADFQCGQLLDMLRIQLTKRKVDLSAMEYDDDAVHSGKSFSLQVNFKQGIEQLTAKKIVKLIKESKIKVQSQVQGDQVRVNGKKRDDLQQVMALVKSAGLDQPFQFNNFRD